jgi:hypothetical protein
MFVDKLEVPCHNTLEPNVTLDGDDPPYIFAYIHESIEAAVNKHDVTMSERYIFKPIEATLVAMLQPLR